MNKNGKKNGLMIGLVIALILVVGVFAYGYMQNVSQTPDRQDIASCADSTGVLTVNSFSALSQASNVTPTLTVGVNGGPVSTTATSGTTTFAVGDNLKIVASLSDYIDTELNAVMTCGGLNINNPMYYATSDNPSIRIKNDDGDYMTDNIAGSTVNQTNLAEGETLSLDVEFTGTSLESSGDFIYIVELPASTSANVTKIEMSGLNSVSVPSVHTSNNAGSKIVAFEVPAIVGSDKKTYTLTIVLGASKDLSGGVYTDFYTKQKFVDTDGTVAYGVQDSDGTAKYENTGDFDFLINSA